MNFAVTSSYKGELFAVREKDKGKLTGYLVEEDVEKDGTLVNKLREIDIKSGKTLRRVKLEYVPLGYAAFSDEDRDWNIVLGRSDPFVLVRIFLWILSQKFFLTTKVKNKDVWQVGKDLTMTALHIYLAQLPLCPLCRNVSVAGILSLKFETGKT